MARCGFYVKMFPLFHIFHKKLSFKSVFLQRTQTGEFNMQSDSMFGLCCVEKSSTDYTRRHTNFDVAPALFEIFAFHK